MNDQELKAFLEENKKLIYSGNVKTVFKKVYKETKEIDWRILFDFLGEALIEKPGLQKGKKYFKFLKGYNDFLIKSKIPKILGKELLMMEKYFLEKYCIYEIEDILYSFLGVVQHKNIIYSERVFITNHRIIVLSNPFAITSINILSVLPFNFTFSVIANIGRAIKSYITKSEETPDKPFFGYIFPISNLTAITLHKYEKGKLKGRLKKVSFTSSIETQSFEIFISAEDVQLIEIQGILQDLQE